MTRWWFQIFYVFIPILGEMIQFESIWLIFFRWVKTTKQMICSFLSMMFMSQELLLPLICRCIFRIVEGIEMQGAPKTRCNCWKKSCISWYGPNIPLFYNYPILTLRERSESPGMMYFPTKWGAKKKTQNGQNHRKDNVFFTFQVVSRISFIDSIWLVVSHIFYFHPYLGKRSHFD